MMHRAAKGRAEALPFVMRRLTLPAYFAAAGNSVTSSSRDRPSVISTGFVSKETVAGFSPVRVAVNVTDPACRVERIATRLIPSSVLRYRLLVELILPEL